MLRWMLSLPILAVVLALPAASQTTKDNKETKGLVKGQDLPGPFQPYNVNGPRAGRYHCLVTQTSLDPMVMIIVRNLNYPDTLKTLEEGLDNRIAKNPNVRLTSFTVFVSDELPNIVQNDDKRDKIADDLRARAKDLKQVIFCLDSKPDLESYQLDDNVWATVVLVKNYKVVGLYQLAEKALTAEKVDDILRNVSDQFGATKK